MSGRVSLAVSKSLIVALVSAALVPGTAWAGAPKAPAGKEPPKGQKPSVPASQPKPPAPRRPVAFTRQMPLGEALDLLRQSSTPPLNIIVLWRPLGDGAGVYRDTPIGIDCAPGLRVGQYLDLLMLSLSAGAPARLGYTVNKGAITISTTEALAVPKPVVRVYDVSDLVAPPGRYSPWSLGFGPGYPGLPAGPAGPGLAPYSPNPGSPSNPPAGTYRRIVPTPRTR